MKHNKNIFAILVLFSIMSFAYAKTGTEKEKPETFESKMIKMVMIDAYFQYKSSISINSFIYDESAEQHTFAESFPYSEYRGVVEIKSFTPYKYYIEKAVIYWELYDPSGMRNDMNSAEMKTGRIDINKFYQTNLNLASNEKCPWCVVIIGIGIISGCAANTALCNERCNNCVNGAAICSSSCFTNSCTVECNPPGNGDDSWIYNPWDSFDDWILFSSGPFLISP